jgi:pimeloyl-ACP methyl ester carboxylesterase
MKEHLHLCIIFGLLTMLSCKEPPAGRMVSFDGYKLHVLENGIGEPTVIFEGGINCSTNSYDKLRILASEFTRVISYDHAGIGYSTQSPNQRTLPNYVSELYRLLEKEKIDPPYILVGHSIGGFIIRYFAHIYPNDVAGLVFIDMPPDDWFNYIRTTHSSKDVLMFNKIFDPDLTVTYRGVANKELKMYEYNTELLEGIKIPRHIPVRMLTSIRFDNWTKEKGYHPEDLIIWAEMQAEVLEGVPDAKQIITEKSGHFIQGTEPELIINAIKDLVYKYRNTIQDTINSGPKKTR